ncbi:MAG TPA: hypothetical protein VNH38_05930 [Candidatus Dormibacteraeota bacterium]|nr:hypothetical protein [Candidatus Dormibacteraeota bacterium]
MEELAPLSPYRSDRQYARLETYRRLGLPGATWAAEQFNLRIHVATTGPDGGEGRAAEVWEAVDRLPLQVKDILREVIDEIRLDEEGSFPADTLGTWRDGTMRINRDWSLIPTLRDPGWHRDLGYDLLRATLVHETGHALVEDPRGGIRLRDTVALIAASGWLPHPLDDPVPYGPVGREVSTLSAYYLKRLRQLDPSWDGELSLGSPSIPSPSQLDRDVMREVSTFNRSRTKNRGSLGLLGSDRLLRRLRREDPVRLTRELAARGLQLEDVDAQLRRRRGISLYAEDSISETPAEIFRCIHAPFTRAEHSRPALTEGERVLLEPWRTADRAIGARRPALAPERPWEALQLVRRGVGRELGR